MDTHLLAVKVSQKVHDRVPLPAVPLLRRLVGPKNKQMLSQVARLAGKRDVQVVGPSLEVTAPFRPHLPLKLLLCFRGRSQQRLWQQLQQS